MIVNRQTLFELQPIKDMSFDKQQEHGVSHGLSEAGYDIRIKQDVTFFPNRHNWTGECLARQDADNLELRLGRFILASAIEEFQMPDNLVGIVHDKSTWARQGLSVFNTVVEPGWRGFLTLELVYHGAKDLFIPAGSGIAQVIFHQTTDLASYHGKYQNQADEPVSSIFQ